MDTTQVEHHRRTGAVRLLAGACLLAMALAAVALDSGRTSTPRGLVDDAGSCRAAGATYLPATDECAFGNDVTVEQGSTLVLGAGVARYSFHRGLAVEGTLVAGSVVTTPDDVSVAGLVQVRGAGLVRTVSAVRAHGA